MARSHGPRRRTVRVSIGAPAPGGSRDRIPCGWRDARAGRPAYGWAILTNSVDRHTLLREGGKELARVFLVAVVVDLIYEVIVFHEIPAGL